MSQDVFVDLHNQEEQIPQNITIYKIADFAKANEQIFVNQSILQKESIPMHSHEFMEIVYVKKGCGIHIINGNKVLINQGDIFMVSPQDIHFYESLTNDFLWMNCIFIPEFLDSSLSISCSIDDIFNTDSLKNNLSEILFYSKSIHLQGYNDEFLDLFKLMFHEYVTAKPAYMQILKQLLIILLTKIKREYIYQRKKTVIVTPKSFSDLVNSFFLENTSYKKVTLKEVAQRVYMSPKYFSRVFKNKVGIGFTDFCLNIRLNRAAELLAESDLKISEIINFVGYEDCKYFYVSFKNRYGMTPFKYREKYKC